jgi:4-oxalocrotonate tautomerase family enzyme
MPFVNVQHMAGLFSEEQVRSLIHDITEAYVRIGGEGIRPAVTVVVNEVADGYWGSGGGVKTKASVEADRARRIAHAAGNGS